MKRIYIRIDIGSGGDGVCGGRGGGRLLTLKGNTLEDKLIY